MQRFLPQYRVIYHHLAIRQFRQWNYHEAAGHLKQSFINSDYWSVLYNLIGSGIPSLSGRLSQTLFWDLLKLKLQGFESGTLMHAQHELCQ